MASTSSHGPRERSISPAPRQRLRKSKSELFQTLRRKMSINMRASFSRSDDSEHPSLRSDPLNTAFLPVSPSPRRRGFPRGGRGSAEGVPPVPPLPPDPDSDELLLSLDPNVSLKELDDAGIVSALALYPASDSPSSPSSGFYSSSQSHSHSGSSGPRSRSPVKFNPSFALGARGPRARSPEALGPTDVPPDYPVPESWEVAGKRAGDLEVEEEFSSDADEGLRHPGRWKLRIFRPDNTEHVLFVSTDDTVTMLRPQLDQKLPPGEVREPHEMYLKERGRERKLRHNERPAHILRRRLQQAGYDESDGYDLLAGAGMAGVPFLLKFVYRSQFLGPTDEDLPLDNFEYSNLTARSLDTIPVALHKHADVIVALRLSRNPMADVPLDFVRAATALRALELSHMCLARVPHSIRHAATLTLLDLSANRLATLEGAGLADLSRLTRLWVQNNRLEHLPRLPPSLGELDISTNRFRALPPAVTALPRLRVLDASFNTVTELPRDIGRLTHLERLALVGNDLAALPDAFARLASLRELDCRRNRIVDLGVACALSALVTLNADHNAVHSLDIALGPSLTELDVSHNGITQLRPPLGSAPCVLTVLDLSNAQLAVLDGAALAPLGALRSLKLDHNALRALPEALGTLTLLEMLSVADNTLSALPASLGRLQRLEALDAHSNGLAALPAELWECASLARLNATSNMLELWHDPPPGDLPPLAHALEQLYLGENELTDEMLHGLMGLKALRVLNLSFNKIQALPAHFFGGLTNLEEVFLSGNRLEHVPSEDLPSLTRLTTLFLNGNRLQHLPHELGQVKSLVHLDVGNNLLKYNINNLDYDWNWNFNKNLMYLNLSGNKQLQIKADVPIPGQRPSTSSMQRPSLSGFAGLAQLRVLGLMDVTITSTGTRTRSDIPDETDDRRVRTSSSLVNGMLYGIADTLGRNHAPLMMDLVHEFRGLKRDTVFAMFGRSQPAGADTGAASSSIAKFLKDNFIRVFIAQLNALDTARGDGVPDALRRAFLKLNQDFHDALFGPARKMSLAGGLGALGTDSVLLQSGASGIVVYIVDRKLFVANTGNALAIVSRGGTAHAVSRKHAPHEPAETDRIRAAEGWISVAPEPGLVNGELDISRSFGFYHLLPVVNARPDVFECTLTPQDEAVVIANRGLWDYVAPQTAVDVVQRMDPTAAAEKLRDLAISYGAEGSTMVMVVSLANLFKETPPAAPAEPRKQHKPKVLDRTLARLKDEVPAPVGHVAIVFTDIKGSTPLWSAAPSGMMTALDLHNDLLRRYLRLCGGYEVRTEGDLFFCAFASVLAAVWWCLRIQVELLGAPWPQDILAAADGRAVHDAAGRLIYRGLSVRVGVHCGSPLCLTDPVTNRMDYFGLVVTRAARIASVAAGGEILFSADVLSELNAARVFEAGAGAPHAQQREAVAAIRALAPVVVPEGEVRLKGLEVPEMLSCVLPATLVGRRDHRDTVARTMHPPSSRVSLAARPAEAQFNMAEVRALAAVCARLETTARGGALPSENLSGNPTSLTDDPDIPLPPDADPTDIDLAALLYSLRTRLESVEGALRAKPQATVGVQTVDPPPPRTKDALVAALRALDARTLDEVWAGVHRPA
ncbi:adenylate cyclase [Mycena latifolia]|nr:adenylate cyclase [Mycena latifolia]